MTLMQKATASCGETSAVLLVLWLTQFVMTVLALYRWRWTLVRWRRAIEDNERLIVLIDEQQRFIGRALKLREEPRH